MALVGVEEKGVCPGPQPVKSLIGGDKDGAALEVDAVNLLDKVRLLIGKQQGREPVREQSDDSTDKRGRHQDVIDGMDNAVLGCLFN